MNLRKITCARKVEKNIHEQLRGYRIDGEWFELPEDVAEYVSDYITNLIPEIYGGE